MFMAYVDIIAIIAPYTAQKLKGSHMPPKEVQAQIEDALALLPATGEIEFDAYKAQLYIANPDGGKAVFTHILNAGKLNKRVKIEDGVPVVYLSRKAA